MTFNKSENINELAAALSKAQGEMEGAKKTSYNPFYKSNYADLAGCWQTCRKALADNGLSVAQCNGEIIETTHYEPLIREVDGEEVFCFDKNGQNILTPVNDMKIEVTTLLMHSSGQWIEHTGKYIVGKQDIQGEGGAITYARRYALAAIVGMAQEDDDGNSNVKPPKPPKNEPKTKQESCVTFVDGVAIVHDSKGNSLSVPMMNENQLRWVLTQPWAKAAHQSARGILNAMEHRGSEEFIEERTDELIDEEEIKGN